MNVQAGCNTYYPLRSLLLFLWISTSAEFSLLYTKRSPNLFISNKRRVGVAKPPTHSTRKLAMADGVGRRVHGPSDDVGDGYAIPLNGRCLNSSAFECVVPPHRARRRALPKPPRSEKS